MCRGRQSEEAVRIATGRSADVKGEPSDTASLRLPAHAVAKEHALHVPADGHLARDDLLIHVEVHAA